VTLWDVRARGWGEVLEGITPQARGEISLQVLKGTLGFFRPSFDEVFAGETVRYVRSVLASARLVGMEGAEADEISGRLYALAETDPAIGTDSLVAALSLFFDCAAGDFDADSVLEILSACYEAVLHTEGLPQDVLDSEVDSDHCAQFVDFQWAVITRFA